MKTATVSVPVILAMFALSSCQGYGIATAPVPFPTAASSVTVVPELAGVVGEPLGQPPLTTWTADGRMIFTFKLQNLTSQQLRLRLRPTFYDEANALIEEQAGRIEFLDDFQIRPFPVTASSAAAKKVQVQVSIAN
jgi:hypothetical protein